MHLTIWKHGGWIGLLLVILQSGCTIERKLDSMEASVAEISQRMASLEASVGKFDPTLERLNIIIASIDENLSRDLGTIVRNTEPLGQINDATNEMKAFLDNTLNQVVIGLGVVAALLLLGLVMRRRHLAKTNQPPPAVAGATSRSP